VKIIDLKEMDCDCENWINGAQDRYHWLEHLNDAMGSIKCADSIDPLSDYQLFKEDAAPWNYLISEFASTEVDAVLTTLTKAAEQATPKLQPSNEASNNISLEIKRLVAVRRKTRATWHRAQAPQDKTVLNRATNQLKIKIKEEKDSSFHNYITGLNRFDNMIWKPLQYRNSPQQQVPPIRDEMASTPKWARSDKEKTKLFAEYLAKVFTPNDTETDPEVEEHLAHVPADTPEIKKITIQEVQKEIRLLKLRKAPGIGRIAPKMIKELPQKAVRLLTFIVNAIILRKNYWPKQLKTAEIILIHKPGKDPTKVESYRSISLLPIMAKLLEKLLMQKIKNEP
jgi:hypothetical protein